MVLRRLRKLALGLAAISLAGLARGQKSPSFTEALLASRLSLTVDGGKLTGPGGEAIRTATADAQYVLLGEDHGIAQIPQFAAALCSELAPHGFHRVELEISPSVAPALERFARATDGAAEMAAFDKRFPDAIAFYAWREEFEFLQRCEKASSEGYEIRGLDQDFMGDSTYILTRISEMKLGAEAQKAIAQLIEEDKSERRAAEKTGNPGDLFMMSAKQEDLDRVRDLLRREGPADARELFESLQVSREIYWKFMNNQGYASNRQRATLMKTTFQADYASAQHSDSAPPKVLFKFGAYHMGRGLNVLHSSEIGDYVAEVAEGRGLKSVHIMIFGVKGAQSAFAGIGKPYAEAPLDLADDANSQLAWAKPLYGNLLEKSWTVFNTRVLRDKFGSFAGVDPEMERMIFAYDYIVLIPETTASHPFSAEATK
jgi:erythromycin esterase-like protein